jgi:hypothetical protein
MQKNLSMSKQINVNCYVFVIRKKSLPESALFLISRKLFSWKSVVKYLNDQSSDYLDQAVLINSKKNNSFLGADRLLKSFFSVNQSVC